MPLNKIAALSLALNLWLLYLVCKARKRLKRRFRAEKWSRWKIAMTKMKVESRFIQDIKHSSVFAIKGTVKLFHNISQKDWQISFEKHFETAQCYIYVLALWKFFLGFIFTKKVANRSFENYLFSIRSIRQFLNIFFYRKASRMRVALRANSSVRLINALTSHWFYTKANF